MTQPKKTENKESEEAEQGLLDFRTGDAILFDRDCYAMGFPFGYFVCVLAKSRSNRHDHIGVVVVQEQKENKNTNNHHNHVASVSSPQTEIVDAVFRAVIVRPASACISRKYNNHLAARLLITEEDFQDFQQQQQQGGEEEEEEQREVIQFDAMRNYANRVKNYPYKSDLLHFISSGLPALPGRREAAVCLASALEKQRLLSTLKFHSKVDSQIFAPKRHEHKLSWYNDRIAKLEERKKEQQQQQQEEEEEQEARIKRQEREEKMLNRFQEAKFNHQVEKLVQLPLDLRDVILKRRIAQLEYESSRLLEAFEKHKKGAEQNLSRYLTGLNDGGSKEKGYFCSEVTAAVLQAGNIVGEFPAATTYAPADIARISESASMPNNTPSFNSHACYTPLIQFKPSSSSSSSSSSSNVGVDEQVKKDVERKITAELKRLGLDEEHAEKAASQFTPVHVQVGQTLFLDRGDDDDDDDDNEKKKKKKAENDCAAIFTGNLQTVLINEKENNNNKKKEEQEDNSNNNNNNSTRRISRFRYLASPPANSFFCSMFNEFHSKEDLSLIPLSVLNSNSNKEKKEAETVRPGILCKSDGILWKAPTSAFSFVDKKDENNKQKEGEEENDHNNEEEEEEEDMSLHENDDQQEPSHFGESDCLSQFLNPPSVFFASSEKRKALRQTKKKGEHIFSSRKQQQQQQQEQEGEGEEAVLLRVVSGTAKNEKNQRRYVAGDVIGLQELLSRSIGKFSKKRFYGFENELSREMHSGKLMFDKEDSLLPSSLTQNLVAESNELVFSVESASSVLAKLVSLDVSSSREEEEDDDDDDEDEDEEETNKKNEGEKLKNDYFFLDDIQHRLLRDFRVFASVGSCRDSFRISMNELRSLLFDDSTFLQRNPISRELLYWITFQGRRLHHHHPANSSASSRKEEEEEEENERSVDFLDFYRAAATLDCIQRHLSSNDGKQKESEEEKVMIDETQLFADYFLEPLAFTHFHEFNNNKKEGKNNKKKELTLSEWNQVFQERFFPSVEDLVFFKSERVSDNNDDDDYNMMTISDLSFRICIGSVLLGPAVKELVQELVFFSMAAVRENNNNNNNNNVDDLIDKKNKIHSSTSSSQDRVIEKRLGDGFRLDNCLRNHEDFPSSFSVVSRLFMATLSGIVANRIFIKFEAKDWIRRGWIGDKTVEPTKTLQNRIFRFLALRSLVACSIHCLLLITGLNLMKAVNSRKQKEKKATEKKRMLKMKKNNNKEQQQQRMEEEDDDEVEETHPRWRFLRLAAATGVVAGVMTHGIETRLFSSLRTYSFTTTATANHNHQGGGAKRGFSRSFLRLAPLQLLNPYLGLSCAWLYVHESILPLGFISPSSSPSFLFPQFDQPVAGLGNNNDSVDFNFLTAHDSIGRQKRIGLVGFGLFGLLSIVYPLQTWQRCAMMKGDERIMKYLSSEIYSRGILRTFRSSYAGFFTTVPRIVAANVVSYSVFGLASLFCPK